MISLMFFSSIKVNPEYEGVYVFDNDFPALLPDVPAPGIAFVMFMSLFF